MFKVVDKTTGEVFTVYGMNGTHFVVYDDVHDWWFFKSINECRPVADDPPIEELRKLNISGGK